MFYCLSLLITQNFVSFFKVMLTNHAQNESNLPCQNALELTYGNVKIKNFYVGYTRTPIKWGGERIGEEEDTYRWGVINLIFFTVA